MVGRQTSRGCSTCRKRKLKCDEVLPACSPCIKAGWKCPGYPDRFVFAGPLPQNTPRPRAYTQSNALSQRPATALVSSDDLLRLQYISGLENYQLAAELCLMPVYCILRNIPERLGSSKALDSAAQCVAQGHRGVSMSDQAVTRRAYGKALQSLRAAIQDPQTVKQPETVAAAFLLQMYEQYANVDGRYGIDHTHGVIHLLQNQGAENISGSLEQGILEAQAGSIFMTGLIFTQDEFLEKSRVFRPCIQQVGEVDDLIKGLLSDASTVEIDEELFHRNRPKSGDDIERWKRIYQTSMSDLLRVRAQLLVHLGGHPALLMKEAVATGTQYNPKSPTYFWLYLMDSLLVWLMDTMRINFNVASAPLPEGLCAEALRNERFRLLAFLRAEYQLLTTVHAATNVLAPLAFRTILGTLLRLVRTGRYAAASYLSVFDGGVPHGMGPLVS